MTDRPAALKGSVLTTDSGRTVPRKTFTGVLLPPTSPIAATFAAGAGGPSAPASVDRAAVLGNAATPGADFFDTVHVFPRAGIAFGVLLTTTTQPFEIYNAYRQSTTIQSFTNNVGSGVTIPDFPSLPYVMDQQTSLLGPTSTRLNPVKMDVQADTEGLASFSGTLDWVLAPGGMRSLTVTGSRTVLVPAFFEGGELVETLEFFVETLVTRTGKEQRISPRKNPRQILQGTYVLDRLERQIVDLLMFDWHARTFGVPLNHEKMVVTQAVSSGATVTVDSTADVDLRVGALAAVFQDARTFDVLTVQSTTSTTVTFTSDLVNPYAVGDLVMPIRLCRLQDVVQGSRPPVNLRTIQPRFVVTDNDTGAPTASTAPFSLFKGKVLLDDCNVVRGTFDESFERDLVVIDSVTGAVFQDSLWDVDKHGLTITRRLSGRTAIMDFRRLMAALRGPQVSFYITTHADDLTVVSNLGSGSSKMQVDNVGYTVHGNMRQNKVSVKVTLKDGSEFFRDILSSTELSSTVEELTLDDTWPSTIDKDDVSRVEFIELVRIDSNEVRIRHAGTGLAVATMPAKVNFS